MTGWENTGSSPGLTRSRHSISDAFAFRSRKALRRAENRLIGRAFVCPHPRYRGLACTKMHTFKAPTRGETPSAQPCREDLIRTVQMHDAHHRCPTAVNGLKTAEGAAGQTIRTFMEALVG